jgi:hypothetical protein
MASQHFLPLLGWKKTKGKVHIDTWNSVTNDLIAGKTPQQAVNIELVILLT